MDFNNEMNQIKSAESSSKYIDEPCVVAVEVVSYKLSESDASYKGNPYLEVTVKTVTDNANDAKIKSITFYRTKDGDSEKAKEFKLKRMKEFMENAEADFSKQGEEVLKDIVGKRLKCLFKNVEYIGKDKDNYNKPVIKSVIEYSFSKKVNEQISGNQSYFHTPLKEVEMEKYKQQLAIWERDHGQSPASNEQGQDEPGFTAPSSQNDDLPF
jgi:hypothetical protein